MTLNGFDAARLLVADALDRPPETVPDDAAVGIMPGWDSMGHVAIVLAVERRIGRELEPAEIGRVKSLRDVADLLQS